MKLKANNLTYLYKTGEGIKDVSFSLAGGRICGLIGPNGSGKSTLLRVLSYFFRPQSGNIIVDGVDISSIKSSERAHMISFMSQMENIEIPYTVSEFVSFGRNAFSGFFPSKEDERITSEVLDRVEMSHYFDRKVTELSGGELQRVIVAQVLAQQSRVILLDEPLSFLDVKGRIKLMKLLKEISLEKNLIVCLSLHDISLSGEYCDDLIVMSSGRVSAWGKSGEVLEPVFLEKIYGLEFEVVNYNGEKVPLLNRNQ